MIIDWSPFPNPFLPDTTPASITTPGEHVFVLIGRVLPAPDGTGYVLRTKRGGHLALTERGKDWIEYFRIPRTREVMIEHHSIDFPPSKMLDLIREGAIAVINPADPLTASLTLRHLRFVTGDGADPTEFHPELRVVLLHCDAGADIPHAAFKVTGQGPETRAAFAQALLEPVPQLLADGKIRLEHVR